MLSNPKVFQLMQMPMSFISTHSLSRPPFFAAGMLDPVNSSQCVQNHSAEEC